MNKRTLTNSYLSSFCLELAMLLQAGIPPGEGIHMLWEDEPDKNGRYVLQCLLDTLEQGLPLSAAMRQSNLFPLYAVNMTEAGEETGRLTEALRALSAYYDGRERLSLAVKNAVTYPTILLVMMVAVILILIVWILPVFNDVFHRLGSQMSPLAVSLMRFGEWLGNASAVIAVVCSVIIAAALTVRMIPAARSGISSAFQNLWRGRGIAGRMASSRYIAVMSMALTSGLEIETAAELATNVGGGVKAVKVRHQRCLDLLRSGSTLPEAMLRAGILSARSGRRLSIGERSGMMETAMTEIAERSERDVRDELDRLVSKIEPALVITASVMVGVILLSVMLPLMGIMTTLW